MKHRAIQSRIWGIPALLLLVVLGAFIGGGCGGKPALTGEDLTATAGEPLFTPIPLPTRIPETVTLAPSPTPTTPEGSSMLYTLIVGIWTEYPAVTSEVSISTPTPPITQAPAGATRTPEAFNIRDSERFPGSVMVRVGHGAISDLAVSPLGDRLAGVSDRGVFSYRLDTLEGMTTASMDGEVGDVAFSPDGEVLAAGWVDKDVVLWEASTGEVLLRMEGHVGPVTSVAWSLDMSRLASGSLDETVIVWEAETAEQLHRLERYTGAVERVEWMPNDYVVISGAWYGAVVWDLQAEGVHSNLGGDTEIDYVLPPQLDMIAAVGRCSDCGVWVSYTEASGVDFYEEPVQYLIDDASEMVYASWSPDGRQLASSTEDGRVILWDGRAGIRLDEFVGHTSPIRTIAWAPRGNMLVTGSEDGVVAAWRVETCEPIPTQGGIAQAREALITYYDLLTQGRYAEAADYFGLYTHFINVILNSLGPTEKAAVMEEVCSWDLCLPIKEVVEERQISPLYYELVVKYSREYWISEEWWDDWWESLIPDLDTYTVMVDCRGGFRVMDYPIYVP